MTREEVNSLLDAKISVKVNEYKVIKNKVLAGIKVNPFTIPSAFVDTEHSEVDIEMGASLEDVHQVITDEIARITNHTKSRYHLSTTSELVGSGSDEEGVESLEFYIVIKTLKDNIDNISTINSTFELFQLIKAEVIRVVGRPLYIMNRPELTIKFFDGIAEFDDIVTEYAAYYTRAS